jgi:RNA 2',3'-cyclic 3'-phosphodiesterase
MRLFIGIPLSQPVVEEISAFILDLRAASAGLRWSAPGSWHITLQFLGNTKEDQLDCILPRLSAVRSSVMAIQLDASGFFARAGVFFAGVRSTPKLLALHQRVIAATSLCGFLPEERAYHPHITLARTNRKPGLDAIKALKQEISQQPTFTPFNANEFALYESFLGREGSRYEIRERFPLS